MALHPACARYQLVIGSWGPSDCGLLGSVWADRGSFVSLWSSRVHSSPVYGMSARPSSCWLVPILGSPCRSCASVSHVVPASGWLRSIGADPSCLSLFTWSHSPPDLGCSECLALRSVAGGLLGGALRSEVIPAVRRTNPVSPLPARPVCGVLVRRWYPGSRFSRRNHRFQ